MANTEICGRGLIEYSPNEPDVHIVIDNLLNDPHCGHYRIDLERRVGCAMSLFCRISAAIAFGTAVAASSVAPTQAADPLPECIADALTAINVTQPMKPRASPTFDGGGGIDRFEIPGRSFYVARVDKLRSVEFLDSRNGLFDFVMVEADVIATTEMTEIEYIADWFDTIVLDPALAWRKTIDPSFYGLVWRAELDGQVMTVRTALDAAVVRPVSSPLLTSEGPAGGFDLATAEGAAAVRDGKAAGALRWTGSGLVRPDLAATAPNAAQVTLDTNNGLPNLVVIDLATLGTGTTGLVLNTDGFDRLMLAQPECWRVGRSSKAGAPQELMTTAEVAGKISLTGQDPRILNMPGEDNAQRTAVPERPGFWHMSASGPDLVHQIDLRNEARDVLMVRNGAMFRHGVTVPVLGDPELDEIWLSGTAGWTLEFTDFGVVARTLLGANRPVSLAFGPGLAVHVLPPPAFLSDPRLRAVSHYPGLPDQVFRGKVIFVTRGGYVRFSDDQIAGRQSVDLSNGRANQFELRPGMFRDVTGTVTLTGDPGLDQIAAIGMPAPQRGPSGATIWTIERAGKAALKISAEGFDIIQRTAN